MRLRVELRADHGGTDYGGVIRRIGTGEVPEMGVAVALLLHPATFNTVTFRFPVVEST